MFVHSFVRTDFITTMSHDWLSSLSETCMEYSLAPDDDLIRFWRSKVKVTAGRWGGDGLLVGALKSYLLVLVWMWFHFCASLATFAMLCCKNLVWNCVVLMTAGLQELVKRIVGGWRRLLISKWTCSEPSKCLDCSFLRKRHEHWRLACQKGEWNLLHQLRILWVTENILWPGSQEYICCKVVRIVWNNN